MSRDCIEIEVFYWARQLINGKGTGSKAGLHYERLVFCSVGDDIQRDGSYSITRK